MQQTPYLTIMSRTAHRNRFSFWVVLVALLLGAALATSADSAAAQQDQAIEPVFVWQVVVTNQADIDELANGGWDLVEARGADHLLVVGTQAVADELQRRGFTVRVDRELTTDGGNVLTYNAGYRTVDEHVAHLANVEATYPNLAVVHDYGDSWRKLQGRTDNDLYAICLTNIQPGDCALNPNSTKPRALIMSAIHARELQTAEVAWRLIDELTQQYGIDGDITHILDTTEVWIIPVVNPDGREIVESGGNSPYMQRKNGNDTVGTCFIPATAFNHHGVDLNRNATWGWGGVGTTLDPCAQTYRGTGPASEPEQSDLETLFTQLWADKKGPAWTDPVDGDVTGSFITIHSYGDLILLPDGQDGQLSPNDAELRAFAFRMAYWNDYVVGTGPEILYPVSGTTDDHVYYDLGVPGFTYELSPRSGPCAGFAPPYSCVDALLWPANRDALIYSMKVAGSPYTEPLGPTTLSIAVPTSIIEGGSFIVTASARDDAYGNAPGSFNRPTPQTIDTIAYWLDSPPADPADPSGTVMVPADGAWDEVQESASIEVSEQLEAGEHTLYVRARNTAGYWGPVTAELLTVQAAPRPDVNNDGDTDNADVLAILTERVGVPTAPFSAADADVDGDGQVSVLDALRLAQLVAQ